jgi:hypothetical protein
VVVSRASTTRKTEDLNIQETEALEGRFKKMVHLDMVVSRASTIRKVSVKN